MLVLQDTLRAAHGKPGPNSTHSLQPLGKVKVIYRPMNGINNSSRRKKKSRMIFDSVADARPETMEPENPCILPPTIISSSDKDTSESRIKLKWNSWIKFDHSPYFPTKTLTMQGKLTTRVL
ncbi:unnamed protein product [Allacma fusca]|uniref:Uncharacterized protein n=1 Tax=Allacma fusca TaxID=39272 RepID=A0A8J2LDQ3_9HEXA|nr:unnamed protein product [Allacma fusca]